MIAVKMSIKKIYWRSQNEIKSAAIIGPIIWIKFCMVPLIPLSLVRCSSGTSSGINELIAGLWMAWPKERRNKAIKRTITEPWSMANRTAAMSVTAAIDKSARIIRFLLLYRSAHTPLKGDKIKVGMMVHNRDMVI